MGLVLPVCACVGVCVRLHSQTKEETNMKRTTQHPPTVKHVPGRLSCQLVLSYSHPKGAHHHNVHRRCGLRVLVSHVSHALVSYMLAAMHWGGVTLHVHEHSPSQPRSRLLCPTFLPHKAVCGAWSDSAVSVTPQKRLLQRNHLTHAPVSSLQAQGAASTHLGQKGPPSASVMQVVRKCRIEGRAPHPDVGRWCPRRCHASMWKPTVC